MKSGPKEVPALERIMRRLPEPDSNGCRVWPGAVSGGYGVINIGQRNFQVHRIILASVYGESLLESLHSCDNKLCCEATHLSYGTHKKNIEDSRDRFLNEKGQILTRRRAWELRFHFKGSLKEASLRFGISVSQACLIKKGKRWSDLTIDEFTI